MLLNYDLLIPWQKYIFYFRIREMLNDFKNKIKYQSLHEKAYDKKKINTNKI